MRILLPRAVPLRAPLVSRSHQNQTRRADADADADAAVVAQVRGVAACWLPHSTVWQVHTTKDVLGQLCWMMQQAASVQAGQLHVRSWVTAWQLRVAHCCARLQLPALLRHEQLVDPVDALAPKQVVHQQQVTDGATH